MWITLIVLWLLVHQGVGLSGSYIFSSYIHFVHGCLEELILLLVSCRMSAVAYLASYLARAKFLPISFVAEYVERFIRWPNIFNSIFNIFIVLSCFYQSVMNSNASQVIDFFSSSVWGFSLLEWCSSYCFNQGGSINPKAHKEFYAGCQVLDSFVLVRTFSSLFLSLIHKDLHSFYIVWGVGDFFCTFPWTYLKASQIIFLVLILFMYHLCARKRKGKC